MTLPAAVLVGAGGAVGALLRYAVTALVDVETFPAGTLTVNALGSFALGAVTFLGAGTDIALFVGVGACGAFTTFSSFAVQTVQLVEQDRPAAAVANAVGNFAGASAAIWLAWLLVRGT